MLKIEKLKFNHKKMKILLLFIWDLFVFIMACIQIILIPIVFLTILEIIIHVTEKPTKVYIIYLLIEFIILIINGLFLYIIETIERKN